MRSIVAISITAALLGACSSSAKDVNESEWKTSTNATAVVIDGGCNPMTPAQAGRAQSALKVLQAFPANDTIFRGGMEWFAYNQELGESTAHCLPEKLKTQVAEATVTAGEWDHERLDIITLRLARQLGPRDPKIVTYVAAVAFSPGAVADDIYTDERPEARSVLASFGQASSPWRGTAIQLMNSKTALGTSAAQVAAASSDPQAVAAVADLLGAELREHVGQAIPRDQAKRTVELAYALGAAGIAARPFVHILTDLLRRNVESLAPPFGIIDRQPNEVCRALKSIGGVEAEDALKSAACATPWSLLPG